MLDFSYNPAQWGLLAAEEEVRLAQTIEAGREAENRLESGNTLDRAADFDQVRRAREARDLFVCSNLRLVFKHALRFPEPRGLSQGDLVQEGLIGLIAAVDRFDWKRGHRFSTFATWWIQVYITRAYAEKSKLIRTPLPVHVNINKVHTAADRLRQRLNRPPTLSEIAGESGLSIRDVSIVRSLPTAVPAEFNHSGGEPGSHFDYIPSPDPESSPLDRALAEERARYVVSALNELSEPQAVSVALRHGLVDGTNWSYGAIASLLDTTPTRAKATYRSAISILRSDQRLVALL